MDIGKPENKGAIMRVANLDGTQLTPGLRGYLESKVGGFTIATGTTGYDVRSQQSANYFTSSLRNVWYKEAGAYYKTAYSGQIGFDQQIDIVFSFINESGAETDNPAIRLTPAMSPWTFPANSLITNIKITNNSGNTVNINPLWLQ